MIAYRVYCLDGLRRFIGAEVIEAEDDEAALRMAAELTGCVHREVWDRDRLVGRIEMDPGE